MDSFTEMDSFSQNLAQRTKEREEFLKKAGNSGGGKSVDDVINFGGEKMETESTKIVEVKVDGISTNSASTPVATVTIKMSDANKENTPKFKYIDDDDIETDGDLPPPVPLTSSGVRGLAALRRKRTGSESNNTPPSKDNNIGQDELTQRSIKPQEAAGFQKASPSRIVYEFPELDESEQQAQVKAQEAESSTPISSLPSNSIIQSKNLSKIVKEPVSPMKVDPKPAPRKSISRAHVMVDKDDPAILPLAVRRALFEAKMRGESLAAQQAIMKTKVAEKNTVSNYISSEPEAKKSRYEPDVNAECVNSVEDNDDKKAQTAKNSSPERLPDSLDTSQHAEEVIQVCLPRCDYPISPESVYQQVPSTNENDVAEALAAFKEIDEISVTSGETTKNTEDKISNLMSKNESTSSLSDISSLIEHINNNESPMGSSTKLYPELPNLDEEFHFDLPKNTAGLRNEFLQLSPIQTVSDEEVSHKTKAVTPRKKADNAAPSPLVSQGPSTPVRTLSMYRREQKMRVNTKEKEEQNKFGMALRLEAQKSELVEKYLQHRANKIQELQREAEKYNNVIFQSLRALEVCLQTNNLSERVEAEKILLINTKKKKACVDQIYHLQKDENHLKNIDLLEILNGPVGKIRFRDLILLVKGDFFVSQVNGNDLYDYHFIALFVCGNKVISTDSLSSSHAVQEAALAFSNEILFEELPRNFEIRLEIYALSLPKHKSHHDRRMVNIRLTPKSKSKSKYTHSPALSASSQKGDGVTSSFKLLGYIILNRENCLKSRFDLIDFMYSSPLEGEVLMKTAIGAKYDITHKSYLNFHEQSGDFPVWNRRWCLLDGYLIYYWRYTEDETDKQPLGVINLKNCVNPSIQKASTDICMRPHSFVFLTVESKNGKLVYTRHLMAADLKEERDEWLEKANRALTQIRFWEADAHHPYDDTTLERLMK